MEEVMEKKIGVITRYYKSINYGGNLQAYALCQFLNKKGFHAEQICFEQDQGKRPVKRPFVKRCLLKMKRTLLSPLTELFFIPKRKRLCKKYNVWARRKNAFLEFNSEVIPHSKDVYNEKNIESCVDNYDIFITGSDIVWNLKEYTPTYFLDFVPSTKKKISYSASFAMDSLTEEQKKFVKKYLVDFYAVSVRESNAVQLLEGLYTKKVVQLLDPTFLLSKEEWDEISSERLVEDKYLFCYFLGDNKKERTLAKKYAKNKGLKIVSIQPSVGTGPMRTSDFTFGDIQIFDATPKDFISLIKYSECVFTDSFHAVVFSQIYWKQFFVFNRNSNGNLNSRIISIVDLLGLSNRFCSNNKMENIDYLLKQENIDYKKGFNNLNNMKHLSVDFLIDNIGD